jgi:hypothetical protein
VWKAKTLADLFNRARACYPDVLRQNGLIKEG